jgi:TnpA family transposase
MSAPVPFNTRVISATMSEAPYVLDGLHHHAHQTDLRIVELYTDTAGATVMWTDYALAAAAMVAPRCSAGRAEEHHGPGEAVRGRERREPS